MKQVAEILKLLSFGRNKIELDILLIDPELESHYSVYTLLPKGSNSNSHNTSSNAASSSMDSISLGNSNNISANRNRNSNSANISNNKIAPLSEVDMVTSIVNETIEEHYEFDDDTLTLDELLNDMQVKLKMFPSINITDYTTLINDLYEKDLSTRQISGGSGGQGQRRKKYNKTGRNNKI